MKGYLERPRCFLYGSDAHAINKVGERFMRYISSRDDVNQPTPKQPA